MSINTTQTFKGRELIARPSDPYYEKIHCTFFSMGLSIPAYRLRPNYDSNILDLPINPVYPYTVTGHKEN